MKKKLFNLMLSAIIFTSTPLFAMDEEKDPGLGAFRVLPTEITLQVLAGLPLEDDILSVSRTSKAIELLHNPIFVVSKEFLTPLPFILSVGAQHRSRRINISPFDFGPYGTYAQGERQKVMQEL